MRTLLIDTCGEVGSIALAQDDAIAGFAELPARSASVSLLSSVRSLLQSAHWSLQELDVIGVVSGPGSFTGVRVGLAAAKGLCEALGIPLVAVSRLRMLCHAADLKDGFASLNAGRNEVYAIDADSGSEQLLSLDQLVSLVASQRVVVAEEQLFANIAAANPEPQKNLTLHKLDVRAALPLVLSRLAQGADNLESVDANYVRGEQQIYGRPNGAKA